MPIGAMPRRRLCVCVSMCFRYFAKLHHIKNLNRRYLIVLIVNTAFYQTPYSLDVQGQCHALSIIIHLTTVDLATVHKV